ncbi:hypothetical protein C7434_3748 [Pantoea sp. PNA 14-12]|uniref:hypothetical protein n=1 Tax=Pantoea TaxID=53335 RepID=UPI00049778C9|nr:hypothetical protein [Pantoea]MCS3401419.1 hypothetical protein [Pantoea sp. B566]TDS68003.1 hypothetical protein C7434_3748 [Pantoea sp. PNA 14-12]
MQNALIKKIAVSVVSLVSAVLLIKYITPLNNLIFTFGSWLFFKLGPGGLGWVGSDYQWGEDPVTFFVALLAVLFLGWLISRIIRRIFSVTKKFS